MRPPTRRYGFTLVEALIGVGVATLVIGGAWMLVVGASKSGKRVLDYSSALEASTSMRARLTLDLVAAFVPRGMTSTSSAFRIEDEGRKVTFLTSPRVADPSAVDAMASPRHEVTWQAIADGGDGYVVERIAASGESHRWSRVRCRDASFRMVFHEGAHYFAADLLIRGSTSAALQTSKDFPVRVTRRLRPQGRILGGMMPFPETIFPDLPADDATPPRSLLTPAQRTIQLTREEL